MVVRLGQMRRTFTRMHKGTLAPNFFLLKVFLFQIKSEAKKTDFQANYELY
jgi:hypothetical protein